MHLCQWMSRWLVSACPVQICSKNIQVIKHGSAFFSKIYAVKNDVILFHQTMRYNDFQYQHVT